MFTRGRFSRTETLENHATLESILTRPIGWIERTVRLARRRPAIVGLMAALAIASEGTDRHQHGFLRGQWAPDRRIEPRRTY